MKLNAFLGVLFLAGLAYAAPASNVSNSKVIITKDFFNASLAKYTAEHDIVNILLPLNNLNFEDDDEEGNSDAYLFIVEADTDSNGKRTDRGLYVMKNYVVTKLLDNGRDATAVNDNTKKVYFGASDGLYVYNETKNKAEKYGSITDSIISIAKVNGSDVIYILTEDHVLYKVTDEGTKKAKVDSVVNAQQIVLDYENNLYYYTGDKKVYVLTSQGVKTVEGLPAATYINILRPPFIIENGVPVVADNKAYIAYCNGTVEMTDFEFVVKPTAYSIEGTLIQYYAYNKKIYEYNLLEMILSQISNAVKDYLKDKSNSIQTIATRSRQGFIPPASEETTERGQ